MLKIAVALAVVILVAIAGFSLIEGRGDNDVTASAALLAPDTDASAFARAVEPYDWSFPRDHGSHPEYQTEWWYYTGNLADESGRQFGYQLTVFRRAIAPHPPASSPSQVERRGLDVRSTPQSEFRTSQIYMAHFTLSDIESQQFHHEQRFSRGGAGLAFALPDPSQPDAAYHVALEDWEVRAGDEPGMYLMRAVSDEGFAVEFTLTEAKGPALQGNEGLSAKSGETGNASYYYSLPRLLTEGTLTVGGETFSVSGASWMDHEFSTSALGSNALGWDWFGLHFDDGRDLMAGQIRLIEGGKEPAFGGLLIDADGSTRHLSADEFTITPTGTWVSPHTDAAYPSGWEITILGADGLTFTVTPLQPDQELHDTDPAYWEGAVRLSGGVSGYGYAELTGYATPMTDRF